MLGLAPLGNLELGFVGQHFSPLVAVAGAGEVSLTCCLCLTSEMDIAAAPDEAALMTAA